MGQGPTWTAPSQLNLRVIHQEDLGFGLARARNNGAKAANGDILVFLDCDMVPEADWLASHARWHHAASDLLTLGFRHHVDVDGIDAADVRERPGTLADVFDGRPVQTPEWIERRMDQTDDLASDADDVFRVVTGGNFAVSTDFFRTVGEFDESFTQWGSEDIEFGWRAYALGAVLVPERSALCWHQGEGAVLSESETISLDQQRDKLSHLIPDRRLRTSAPGRSYTVPQFVVTVDPGHSDEEEVLATVERVLASDVHDLVVWVAERPAEPFERLRRLLDPDPRVRVGEAAGAADAFPSAAFHVRVPAGAAVRSRMLDRLQNQLGTAVSGESDLASGHRVSITRGWAVHRARRSGRLVSEVGAVAELDVDSLEVTQEAKPQGWLAGKLHEPAKRVLRAVDAGAAAPVDAVRRIETHPASPRRSALRRDRRARGVVACQESPLEVPQRQVGPTAGAPSMAAARQETSAHLAGSPAPQPALCTAPGALSARRRIRRRGP